MNAPTTPRPPTASRSVGQFTAKGRPSCSCTGLMGDGQTDWRALAPHLTGRFTCHQPSMRGRGLSGAHPDLDFGRMVNDIIAYVDSIGQATGLVGWSLGADLALTVAAQSDRVGSVAAVEMGMPHLMGEEERAAFSNAVARTAELAAENRLTDAVRAFAGALLTDEEVAMADDAGYVEAAGRYVLNFFQQQMEYHGPTAADPSVLGAISDPVLLLSGSRTKPYATASARYVADHVPNARMQEIPGAGHAAPLTHPEALAEALTDFLSPAQLPN
jgi:pimeloyl-ACP methyl ester carboxylesterase